MGMQQKTGPSGYPSNYAAILDLLRFGFGIWGQTGMAVILFHAERSTAYGRTSDQHSRSQAIRGIYSRSRRAWVRGPSGVGNGTWLRENAALTIDPTSPNKPSARPRVLRKITRSTTRGGHAATEYAIDWLAIRAAIADWKEAQTVPALLPMLHGNFSAPPLTHDGSRACPTAGHGLTQDGSRACPTMGHTVGISSESSEVSESRAQAVPAADPTPPSTTHPLFPDEDNPTPAADLLAAIEDAYGRPLQANDPIPGQILAIAQRLDLPALSLHRFIHSRAADWQARGYTVTSPRLFVLAAQTDLIPWIRANRETIARDAAAEERDAYRRYCALQNAQTIPFPEAASQPETVNCPNTQEVETDGPSHRTERVQQPRAANS